MLTPLALSYTNIGPFADQTLQICVSNGSYLIQAPIGSGKSFLFFDGPLFALYKHRDRPILNKTSKKGAVEILFQLDSGIYMIRRELTMTKKGGESIKSKLWSYTAGLESIYTYISGSHLEKNSHELSTSLPAAHLQELESTSQKEIDALINGLLPPKEVVLSTGFLIQQSESVFELAPANRIQVFKHMFGLLGIDEGKEKLNESRKSIQTQIHILGDHSAIDTKVQSYISQLLSHTEQIQHIQTSLSGQKPSELYTYIQNLLAHTDLKDLQLLDTTSLGIQGLSRTRFDQTLITQIQDHIQLKLSIYNQLTGQLTSVQQQTQQSQQQILTLTTTLDQTKTQAITTKSKIDAIDTTQLNTFKNEQVQLTSSAESILQELPRDPYHTYISTHPSPYIYKKNDPLDFIRLIDESLTQGKLLRQQEKHIQEQITQIDKEEVTRSMRNKELEKHVQYSKKNKESQTMFHCEKIQGACPYIHLINKQASTALENTIQQAEAQLQKHIEQHIDPTEKKQNLLSQLETTQQELTSKGVFLKSVQWADTQEKIKQRQIVQQNIQHIQKQRDQLQHQVEQLTTLQSAYISLTQKISITESQIAAAQHQQKEVEDMSQKLAHDIGQIPVPIYQKLAKEVQKLDEVSNHIYQIIADHASQQITLKKLQDTLKKTKELYHIFSKELMIVVLQDFLPSLEAALNTYLAQLVDYQVSFKTPNSDGDQLELDIDIIDEKGRREVKSLSGGQKTILKLVWMLSVATIMNSQFLFLDETINNLDKDTVSLVAEVLKNFVKSRKLMFYVVTHSSTIQEMDIRENIIYIPNT